MPSASDCTAVGTATNYEAKGIIERWNGSTWTPRSAPLLPGTTGTTLSGVAVAGGKYSAVGFTNNIELFGWVTYVARSS